MNQFLLVSFIIDLSFVLTGVWYIVRIRRYIMNHNEQQALTTLWRPVAVLAGGGLIAGVAWWSGHVWIGLIARLVVLTGVAMYFNALHKLVETKTLSHEFVELMRIGIWLIWFVAFINTIVHVGLLWLY